MEKNHEVLIGDAKGIDSIVQGYFFKNNYKKLKVYSTNETRNNIGAWENIIVKSKNLKKNKEYFILKDKKMAKDANCGFMIWDRKSEGTLNDMIMLLNYKKEVVLFIDEEDKIYHLKDFKDLKKIIKDDEKLKALFLRFLKKLEKENPLGI